MKEHQDISDENLVHDTALDKCHSSSSKQGDIADEIITSERDISVQNDETCKDLGEKRRLHPFVHWAQSQTHISLRVDLVQVDNLDVSISDTGEELTFKARGTGAHGLQIYGFSIEFYSQVDREVTFHPIERYVLIFIKKIDQQVGNWPRLTKQQTKFPWLRVDFDRFRANDSDDDSIDNISEDDEFSEGKRSYELLQQQLNEAKNQEEKYQSNDLEEKNSWTKRLDNIFSKKSVENFDIFNPFNKRLSRSSASSKTKATMKHDYRKEKGIVMDNSRNTARHALDAKKTYLFLYNLVMFIMFLKVYIVLMIKGLSGTVDDDIVQGAALIIKILTWAQFLETLHPILGLVPGGPLMPFMQTFGRLLVNCLLSYPEIRLGSAPFTHYLFIVWSSIEVFRYSFYALRVFKVNIYALTWCRYTLFLPLYPMGGFCESMVILSAIRYFEETGSYSLTLPNPANISFNLPLFFRVYIIFFLMPAIYSLMKYMWRQRCMQLKEKLA